MFSASVLLAADGSKPISFPKLVGGDEGKGLVALVSTTGANDITGLLRHH